MTHQAIIQQEKGLGANAELLFSIFKVCEDIDECKNNGAGCVENSVCINTPVSAADPGWSHPPVARPSF